MRPSPPRAAGAARGTPATGTGVPAHAAVLPASGRGGIAGDGFRRVRRPGHATPATESIAPSPDGELRRPARRRYLHRPASADVVDGPAGPARPSASGTFAHLRTVPRADALGGRVPSTPRGPAPRSALF